MGWPQIIYLGLLCASLGVHIAKHGQPRGGQHSFGWALLGASLQVSLLIWGGFFTVSN